MMDTSGSEKTHSPTPAQVIAGVPIQAESFGTRAPGFGNLKVTVERYGIKTCPECHELFNTTNIRPVQPGCGHIKCRACYVEYGDCRQCNPEMINIVETPFPCSECNQSFGLESTLDLHLHDHFVERPHSCRRCGEVFSCLKVLRQHILTHPGERPFGCWICEKSFRRKGHLERHMKNIHKQPKVVTCTKVAEAQDLNLKSE